MKKFNCILLVDDDSINNFINRKLLSKLDIAEKIEVANNGKEAIDYINEFCASNDTCCPELILLDINMPVMNGFEFLNTYKTLNLYNSTKIRIVMLTTSSDEKDTVKIENLGIKDYITKPLTKEKLETVLYA